MKYLELLRQQLASLEQRHAAILDELDALATDVESRGATTTPEETELARSLEADAQSVNGEADALRSRIAEMEATVTARANAPRPVVPGATPGTDNPYDIDVRSIRLGHDMDNLDSRARRALEQAHLGDAEKAHIERRLNDDGVNSRGLLARHILVTGGDEYRRAFAASITHGDLTERQRHVLRSAREEYRAMTVGTDAAGGFLMPFTLDPTLIDINAGVANPMRALANVKTTMTDNWQGVTSAGVTASWDAEEAEVSDDTPTLAQPAISVKQAQAFVPFSVMVDDDLSVLADLTAEFGRAKDRLESAAFATGAASSTNPVGLITGLVAASKTVASATTDTYAIADVYATQNALPDRYDASASWLMNKAVVNLTRQFGTANAHTFLVYLDAAAPGLLLGAPLYRYSSLDGVINSSADNYIAVYGDIRQAYTIVDRIGLTVELVPHLFHTSNNRPSGQRGLYARWRVGAAVVNADAARVLNVT